MALVATSRDSPDSSWLNSLSETDTQDWFNLSTKFLNPFDSATIHFKAQAQAQIIQLATHESIFVYACRVDGLVSKGRPEFDSKMKNHDHVINFIQVSNSI